MTQKQHQKPTMHAVTVAEVGGPEVMTVQEVERPRVAPFEVQVQLAAAGVNFIDTYHRSGLYPMELPLIPGSEGAGVVTAVGAEVTNRAIGDRVAWAAASGTYAEYTTVPAEQTVVVPGDISLPVAAATMLQGMTAHYLVASTWPLAQGQSCLIHAGAGGVGLILIQLAKQAGATVYTTVGTAEKAELASAAGADHTILYRDVDFAETVRDLAGHDHPLDVVYDGVGAVTFEPSLTLLRARGMMVTFGNASGPVEPTSPLTLGGAGGGSLFLTRPRLWDYLRSTEELAWRASELFDAIRAGRLSIRIGHTFALADAAAAHTALEGRVTTGKILLTVDESVV